MLPSSSSKNSLLFEDLDQHRDDDPDVLRLAVGREQHGVLWRRRRGRGARGLLGASSRSRRSRGFFLRRCRYCRCGCAGSACHCLSPETRRGGRLRSCCCSCCSCVLAGGAGERPWRRIAARSHRCRRYELDLAASGGRLGHSTRAPSQDARERARVFSLRTRKGRKRATRKEKAFSFGAP